MGLNVSASTGHNLDNNEVLRNAARGILKRAASSEATQQNIEKMLFNTDAQIKELYTNSQLAVLKASTQISINESLKETLKYLKNNANKNVKKTAVLGELWNIFAANNDASEENPYRGELFDFEIDKNAKNIFAA